MIETQASGEQMPEELHPRHLRARLLQLAALLALVVAAVWLTPGLGALRSRLQHASGGWLAAAAAMELLSTLSYVVVFRSVFCPRMSWRISYQIGMAEQAANSLLPAGGAGGLALGAWELRRGGMSAEHIARRTVAFFLLTSLPNVSTLIVFAAAFAAGLVAGDSAPAVTFGFAGAGVLATLFTVALPWLIGRHQTRRKSQHARAGRLRNTVRHGLDAVADGVRDAITLLRHRRLGALAGAFGYMAFDIAVLGFCFSAFGGSPPFGVLVVAYLIGQLGGLLPIPGGIGGTEGGLIGTFALYHQPLAAAAVAVLAYRALQLWIPAMLGSVAFVQLRATLRREVEPAAICSPLAEPIEVVSLSAAAGRP
jgi:uncharacterized protein (TIRG00374 family)